MRIWMHELQLLFRARLALIAIVLLGALSVAAIVAGLAEVDRQRTAIAAIAEPQKEDIAAIAAWIDKGKDAGSAAYYSFHPTWDAPSPLAFAAIGMRDVSPYTLRVRALGLEAQIYDGDVFNPELALPGRFDFSFLLVFLTPLFVIALFHDLVSGEREAGRERMLSALPGARRLWLRRVALRFGILFAVVVLPFTIAAMASGAAGGSIVLILLASAAYLVFWIALALLVGRLAWSSVANAATLAACWLILTLVLPTLAHVTINSAVPVDQGTEIALAQREKVNAAWEIPREETMRQFYTNHPKWANSPRSARTSTTNGISRSIRWATRAWPTGCKPTARGWKSATTRRGRWGWSCRPSGSRRCSRGWPEPTSKRSSPIRIASATITAGFANSTTATCSPIARSARPTSRRRRSSGLEGTPMRLSGFRFSYPTSIT